MHEYLRTRKAIGCMIVIVACFVVVVFLEVELNEIVFFVLIKPGINSRKHCSPVPLV